MLRYRIWSLCAIHFDSSNRLVFVKVGVFLWGVSKEKSFDE